MKKIILSLLIFMVSYSQSSHLEAEESPQKKYQCQLISRTSAIKQAQSRANGKVIGVKLSRKGRHSIYKVRMLVDKKRVKTTSIKACR